MPRCLFLLLFVLGTTVPAHAQLNLTWTLRGDLTTQVPSSIEVYEATNSTIPLKAWYIKADLSDTTWTTDALLHAGQTTQAFAQDAEALVAINGGYFGGGQSFSLVASGGQTLVGNIAALNRSGTTYYPTRGAFGIRDDGTPDVSWIYGVSGTTYAYPTPNANTQSQAQPQPTATFPAGGAPWPITTGIGGGPVLVENGQSRITWEEEVFFGSGIGSVTDWNPRTAIGYTASNELLLMVVDGRQTVSRGVSLEELAQLMIDLGAVEALNLDGGGSSTLVVNNTLINRPGGGSFQRAVASAFVLVPNRTPPPPPAGVIFFDTGDACCYRESGSGWFESANAPFYGATPSRLHPTASPATAEARFVFENLEAGVYELAAWWVPASNRATDTPFTIYQEGVPTTIRVDQSDAATLNQWNVLGTFALAPGDSVVVRNDASGAGSSTFINVDALRLEPRTNTSREALPPALRQTLRAYPNPASDHITLAYTLMQDGPVRGRIVDVMGRTVYRFSSNGVLGEQTQRLHLPALASGFYMIRLTTPDGLKQRPVVLTR